jgi:hypothetical protein
MSGKYEIERAIRILFRKDCLIRHGVDLARLINTVFPLGICPLFNI